MCHLVLKRERQKIRECHKSISKKENSAVWTDKTNLQQNYAETEFVERSQSNPYNITCEHWGHCYAWHPVFIDDVTGDGNSSNSAMCAKLSEKCLGL